MNSNFNNDNVEKEFRNLVEFAEKSSSEVDIYCELMKKMFLSNSSMN